MFNIDNMNRKQLLLTIVTIAIVFVALIGASYAYFSANVGNGAMTLINVKTYGADGIVINPGNSINISGSDWSKTTELGSGTDGSMKSWSTSSTVAYSGTTTVTYNGYLIIGQNSFEYTSGTSPEIVVDVLKNGTSVTSMTQILGSSTNAMGRNSTLGGYDVTGKTGVFQFAVDVPLTNGESDVWTVNIKPVNVGGQSNDQNANANAKIVGSLYFTNRETTIKEVLLASMGAPDVVPTISDIPGEYLWGNYESDEPRVLKTTGVIPCNFNPNEYVTYASSYSENDFKYGFFSLQNKQACRYSDCYSTLVGKYVYLTTSTSSTPLNFGASGGNGYNLFKVTSASAAGAIWEVMQSEIVSEKSNETNNELVQVGGQVNCFTGTGNIISFSPDGKYVYDPSATNKYMVSPIKSCDYTNPGCRESLYYKYVNPNRHSFGGLVASSDYLYKVVSIPQDITEAQCLRYRISNSSSNYSLQDKNMVIKAGDNYVYRGAVSYNWASFGGYIWRIIKVADDGSVMLMYAGTASQYNTMLGGETIDARARIHGWHYPPGTTYYSTSTDYEDSEVTYDNSLLKSAVESWYNSHLGNTDADGAVVTSKFYYDTDTCASYSSNHSNCNPYKLYMKVGVISYLDWLYAGRSGENYSKSYLTYPNAAYWRMPTLEGSAKCSNYLPKYDCDTGYNSGTPTEFYPVINVNGKALFTGGSGQVDDPYVISNDVAGW